MKILLIGDVFGKPGRQILHDRLAGLCDTHGISATIVNIENAAGGFGVTPEIAEEMIELGVDMMTSGNHIWNKKQIYEYIGGSRQLLRPHNMSADGPGSGIGYIEGKAEQPIAVINLIGRVFMGNYDCPFQVADELIERAQKKTNIIVVDFHAEATSEKRALGWHLDGRASVVFGTHTHIQTADAQVMTAGTGYITDLGMTGPHESVIGVEKDTIIQKFITQMPLRFTAATQGVQINGAVADIDEKTGRTRSFESFIITED